MARQHGTNEIDRLWFSEVENFDEQTDTGDEPLQWNDSQLLQMSMSPTTHKHAGAEEEAENKRSQTIDQENQSAQHLEIEAESAHN